MQLESGGRAGAGRQGISQYSALTIYIYCDLGIVAGRNFSEDRALPDLSGVAAIEIVTAVAAGVCEAGKNGSRSCVGRPSGP